MSLAVQRLREPGDGRTSHTVVDCDGLPVGPIEDFLVFLAGSGLSPNTVQGYAYDLRDFFVWLGQEHLDFRRLTLEQLAQFFDWLKRPKPTRAPGVFLLPGSKPALASSTLSRKRAAVGSFYRFHSQRDAEVQPLLGQLLGPGATGRFIPMLVHTRRSGPVEYNPIRIHTARKRPQTLTADETRRLVAACRCRRDRFLITLLDESGLRIGEALGLRHSDLNLRRGEVEVVPREHNVNKARAKGLKARTVPVRDELFDLYADYMETEYGTLDNDYVFVNLFRPPIGSPMTRANVNELVQRLRERTGITRFSPHACRHTYATRLLRAQVPITVVAELLGHSSPQVTSDTYSHLTVEDHRRALAATGLFDTAMEDPA